jgi:hypothetical protein
LIANTDYFFKNKNNSDGLMGLCKECKGFKYTHYVISEGYKYCNGCNRELPATNEYFLSDKKSKSGLYSLCRKCTNERRKEYYSNNADKLRMLERDRYHKNNEKIREGKRRRYLENKNHIHEYMSNYRKVNKHKIKRYWDNYYSKNKGKRLMKWHDRRNSDLSKLNLFNLKEWEECLAFFGNKDAYTGKEMRIKTQDHVIPISRGGLYIKQNIVPCDLNINSSKKDRNMEEWYREQTFFSESRLKKIYKWTGVNDNKQQLKLL